MFHGMSALRSIFIAVLCLSTHAYAWGERGHHSVAIVAARLSAQELGPDVSLSRILIDKEFMLAHLANVPDIVWRSIDQATTDLNVSTHFIDIEYVAASPTLVLLPRTFSATQTAVRERCKLTTLANDTICSDIAANGSDAIAKTGTAPLRVQQLQQMMAAAFLRAGQAKDTKAKIEAVNDALIAGGILAHFIGDLAQPLHTTRDYDGFETGHGGLHAYFESDLVQAQDLSLLDSVYRAALPRRELKVLLSSIAKVDRERAETLPMELAYAEALDSHANLERLRAMDKKTALKRASSGEHGMKIPAVRELPAKVAASFRPFIVQRLSLGAQTLAHLWVAAYKQGGSPDLKDFKSYYYPVAPTFIAPAYLTVSH
jgi:hypothetical protein